MKIFTAAFLASLFMAGTASGQEKVNKLFKGVEEIKMNTASGNCKFVKGAPGTVTVQLEHEYSEDVYRPEIKQQGEKLYIEEHFKGNSSGRSPKWTITVPDNMNISFATGSGEISASDLAVTLSAKSGSGDISLQNCKGDVRGASGSGNVELTNHEGQLKATSGSGDISIASSKGEMSLTSGSGDVRIERSSGKFAANTGSGSVAAKDITLTEESKFNSGSGNAHVVLSASPAYALLVNSGSGDAVVDFGGNDIKGEIVMKANKRHGRIIAPFDFDKVEEIEEGGDQVTIKKTVVKGGSDVKISIGTGSGEAVLKN